MSTNNNPITPNSDERIHELERRLAASEAAFQAALDRQSEQIAQLLSRLPASVDVHNHPAHGNAQAALEFVPSVISRRSMLKNAALATLGAATVMEIMPSAKASNSNYLNLGAMNSASAYTALTASIGSSTVLRVNNTGSGAALEGSATQSTGVFGLSIGTSGSGVVGTCNSGTGVSGSSESGTGVQAASTTGNAIMAESVSGNGVHSTTSSSSTVPRDAAAITGISNSTSTYGVGVFGQCDSGTAVVGQSADYYGAFLKGGLAPVLLAAGSITDPNGDTQTHAPGELFVDSNEGLWYNTTYGTPGVWRKLADAGTAGALNLLSAPTRFVDTRTPAESASSTSFDASAPAPDAVATYAFTGAARLMPYSPPNGFTAIPYGATALVGRITVIAGKNGHTAAGGTLKVSNQNPPGFGSGLITWGAGPSTPIVPFVLTLANGPTAGSNGGSNSGVLYVQNVSSDEIDLVVDITGFYY